MKQSVSRFVAILVVTFALAATNVQAGHGAAAGIGLRSSWWDRVGSSNRIIAHTHDGTDEVDIGGAGAHLYLLSRASDRMMLELNIGSVGSVKGRHEVWESDEDYDVTAVVPITLGVRGELLPNGGPGPARPYFSAGAGPYFIARASVHHSWFEDEVIGEWDSRMGAYLGAGLDYRFLSWLWLNLDVRHHFVEMDAHNPNSGFEYGLGLQFMWGRSRR